MGKSDLKGIKGTACVITGGFLDNIHAKTAHGLIRQSDRFKIVGVLDEVHAGKDAGEVLDGENRGIPIFSSLDALLKEMGSKPDYMIIGMATKGGKLPKELYPLVREVLNEGISLVNGLHETVGDIEEFNALATQNHVNIYDIRKPKSLQDLHFWSGKIKEITTPKIAVLGTDCALGKRTTSKLLVNELMAKGVNAHMIFTGQTGWMQGGKYGFIFDSTPNDFISGELEHEVYECWKNENPDLIVLEGQSALRNPSGPCGSEYIISCDLDGVILQHAPSRKYYNGLSAYGKTIPPVEDEIALIKHLGVDTLAVTLNTQGLSESEARKAAAEIEDKTGVPAILPLYDDMSKIINALGSLLNQ